MTSHSDSIPPTNEAWLKELIHKRESLHAERQQNYARQNLHSQASSVALNPPTGPVSISRSMWEFCVNTLNYIGEHPVEFALSMGVAMAVRWGVTAGLIAIGSGAIGGLGLAIAASMITSVILGVGKAALKGESVSLGDLAEKATLSGLISGVLGAFLGGLIPSPAADAAHAGVPGGATADTPQAGPGDINANAPQNPSSTPAEASPPKASTAEHHPAKTPHTHPPSDGTQPHHAKEVKAEPQHAPERASRPVNAPAPVPAEPFAFMHGKDAADQYGWKITPKEWTVFKDHLESTNQEITVVNGRGGQISVKELLNWDSEWYGFTGRGNMPYQVVSRDALEEMILYTHTQALKEGLLPPTDITLTNTPTHFGASKITHNSFRVEHYKIAVDAGYLAHDKEVYEAFLGHEYGHVHHYNSHHHTTPQSPHDLEFEADDNMLRNDNYGGYMKTFSLLAVDMGSGWTIASDSHPSLKERLLRGIELAAQDNTFDAKERILFEQDLKECENILKGARLPGVPDLLAYWKQQLGVQTASLSR